MTYTVFCVCAITKWQKSLLAQWMQSNYMDIVFLDRLPKLKQGMLILDVSWRESAVEGRHHAETVTLLEVSHELYMVPQYIFMAKRRFDCCTGMSYMENLPAPGEYLQRSLQKGYIVEAEMVK